MKTAILIIILLPIIGFAQTSYQMEEMRNVTTNNVHSSPNFISIYRFSYSLELSTPKETSIVFFQQKSAYAKKFKPDTINKRKASKQAFLFTLPCALMSAMIGSRSHCTHGFYDTCSPTESSFGRAFVIGSFVGASLGYVAQKKEINKKYSIWRVLTGTAAGGNLRWWGFRVLGW